MSHVVSQRLAATGKRGGIRKWSKHFPLKTIDAVVELFEAQISSYKGPDLACLSLVLGALEVRMTTDVEAGTDAAEFPQLNFTDIESLYQRFQTILRQNIPADGIASSRHGAVVVSSKEIVHKVSNVVWSYLSGSYHKDRAHIQSLYSFLTGWSWLLFRRCGIYYYYSYKL